MECNPRRHLPPVRNSRNVEANYRYRPAAATCSARRAADVAESSPRSANGLGRLAARVVARCLHARRRHAEMGNSDRQPLAVPCLFFERCVALPVPRAATIVRRECACREGKAMDCSRRRFDSRRAARLPRPEPTWWVRFSPCERRSCCHLSRWRSCQDCRATAF